MPSVRGQVVARWEQARFACVGVWEKRTPMPDHETDREMRLRALASKLFFTLRREGPRFGLYRDVDVSTAVRHDGLSLDEVEDILNTWKLRGPHGG
jgi:hypothetical protein